ncbi:hypothetical protein [Pseudonocardia sp. ICBG1142]|uniref:hypothetical protein n=1 Tax=Pseudonocardia sp. ICBG1142 TaxID=2846760 RepID=UPI0027E158D1|nr:hypothetical protein [Pseudonocardia sp. ICBG1142]
MTSVDVTRTRRRWLVLAVGVFAQTAACSFVYGLPFVVPLLRDSAGLTLAQAGAYVGAPTVGLLCTLVLWGRPRTGPVNAA